MKKIIILFLVFLASPLIISQEFDDSFIDSLPKDVQEDILSKVDAKENLDSPIYRRASTSIDKDEDEDKDEDSELSVFGFEFFDTIQTTFMPINEPNLDASYILDFGDVLQVQIIGQKDSIDLYPILRDGSIYLEDIGKITLSGLSLGEATSYIKKKIGNAFIGTEAFISLESIRDINVLIVGNAYNPGIYTVNGNSNMLHALMVAGGINDMGSYRNIDRSSSP